MKTWVVSIETKRYGAVLYRPYFMNDRYILINRQRPLILVNIMKIIIFCSHNNKLHNLYYLFSTEENVNCV